MEKQNSLPEKLPTDYPFGQAFQIYAKRFGVYLLVVAANYLLLGVVMLLIGDPSFWHAIISSLPYIFLIAIALTAFAIIKYTLDTQILSRSLFQLLLTRSHLNTSERFRFPLSKFENNDSWQIIHFSSHGDYEADASLLANAWIDNRFSRDDLIKKFVISMVHNVGSDKI